MNGVKGFFNPPATDQTVSEAKIRSVMVNPEVYRAYLFLYSCAFDMVKQMEAVLKDSHHQEILMRGPALGYVMPDEKKIAATTLALRTGLESFDTDDANFVGNRVCLPIETARGLYNVAMLSDRLADEVFLSIRKSEYMLWIRALKATGEVYEGATSLQEVVDVVVAFYNLAVKQVVHPSSRTGQKLQANWAARPG
ncbi:MAG: hypothetical protein JWO78_1140 [Micavibrio sp.]|nr:hypothetical protein [Micavibrio sp.]